jgi:4-hydroxy-2-oxoheptanedioate aldolase
MHPSIVKRKLRDGKPVLAAKSNFMSPRIVEMMGLVGFDCLWICNEHLSLDMRDLDHAILACRASGMDTMLRRNVAGYHDLLQPLELGVHGFMIPRVRSVEYLRKIVEYVKFPPAGRRGLDGVNADAEFGLLPVAEYTRRANDETFIVAQIENPEALDILDGIASIDGIDVLFVGQGDLSLALGIPGQVRHDSIIRATEKVLEACAKHGKTAGIPALSAEDAQKLMSKGFRFFTTGADYRFIRNGLLALRKDFSEIGFTFRGNPNLP